MKLEITKGRLRTIIAEEHSKLLTEGLLLESASRPYELGDQVVTPSGAIGEVITLQAYGAVVKLEDGTKEKFSEEELEPAPEATAEEPTP
jgi:hypothetical protein